MSEEEDVPEYRDRYVYCPHLLLCRSVWFDNRQPERGFSLGGIHTVIPVPDDGLPVILNRPFVYFQLSGLADDYFPKIRVVQVVEDGYDGEDQLGDNGEQLEFEMPTERPVELSESYIVREFAFRLDELAFWQVGTYEVQLWIDGFDEPIGRERIRIGEG
jgi:hypothetical protein